MLTKTTKSVPEWRIMREFRINGVIVSPGDPVPDLDTAERERLVEAGFIARRRADGTFARPEPPEPQTAEDCLFTGDPDVIRRIRRYKPNGEVVREILLLAEQSGRCQHNATFREALRLAAGVEDHTEEPF